MQCIASVKRFFNILNQLFIARAQGQNLPPVATRRGQTLPRRPRRCFPPSFVMLVSFVLVKPRPKWSVLCGETLGWAVKWTKTVKSGRFAALALMSKRAFSPFWWSTRVHLFHTASKTFNGLSVKTLRPRHHLFFAPGLGHVVMAGMGLFPVEKGQKKEHCRSGWRSFWLPAKRCK